MQKKYPAFTLIELMIIVTIVGILVIISLIGLQKQLPKARDGQRKADLNRLKIAFEDYYNDHNCYPPPEWFDNSSDCGSNVLRPYLSSIPCDKKTRQPYIIQTDNTGCTWYKIYTNLENSDDPAVFPPVVVNTNVYNYGVSSGSTPAATSSDSISHNYYYCSDYNDCTANLNPTHQICSPIYIDDPNCGGTIDSKCPTIGSCHVINQ